MNHYLIELYTPNTAWKTLSFDERKDYLNHIATAMNKLTDTGVKALTLTALNTQIDQSSDHQFLAIWSFPDQQTCDALLAGIKASGWYDYFDHVNAAGATHDFNTHLDALIHI
ncbi:DUF6616 family protein [Acinetobacter sp. SAAs474]|uniref:DUF6616 family protein n=2 Tax=unclassified Acinetobacter TaxID=196816 RepID=UPI002934F086|nr:DUF6616 family protein [Acinetobacter sp. SAAs474]WOE37960.1 hypothetical protein QSG86_13610 [Acinetobacter sp. SAAs474]